MTGIAKQIKFLSVLYGYNFRDVTDLNENIENDAPRSVKDDVHKSPTPAEEDEETMSNYDKLLITDCLNHLYTRTELTLDGPKYGTHPINPHADILSKACLVFLGCYNSYLRHLDGFYMKDYGILKFDELEIKNLQSFSDLLQEAVNLNFMPSKVQRISENYLRTLEGGF